MNQGNMKLVCTRAMAVGKFTLDWAGSAEMTREDSVSTRNAWKRDCRHLKQMSAKRLRALVCLASPDLLPQTLCRDGRWGALMIVVVLWFPTSVYLTRCLPENATWIAGEWPHKQVSNGFQAQPKQLPANSATQRWIKPWIILEFVGLTSDREPVLTKCNVGCHQLHEKNRENHLHDQEHLEASDASFVYTEHGMIHEKK